MSANSEPNINALLVSITSALNKRILIGSDDPHSESAGCSIVMVQTESGPIAHLLIPVTR